MIPSHPFLNGHVSPQVIQMKTIMRSMTCVIVLIMALAVLPASIMVSADTTDRFGDGSTSKTMDFPDKGSNHGATILLPAEAEVSEARLTITGGEHAGNNPHRPTFLVNDRGGQVIWNFNGSGFGQLGRQTHFSSDAGSASLSFAGNEEKAQRLYLPKDATVTSATMDISGRKSTGSMGLPETLSGGSLITRHGAFPRMAVDGSSVYMIWIDNGDLEYAGRDQDIFFKRSTDSGASWGGAVVLSQTTMDSFQPSIAVNDDEVLTVWLDSSMILWPEMWFRASPDGGESWGKPERLDFDTDWETAPVVSGAGSYRYLVWNYDNKINFARDTGHGRWESQVISEDGGSGGDRVMDPFIASHGGHVYVGWLKVDQMSRTTSIQFKHSSNNGQTFPVTPTEIASTTRDIYDPSMASDDGGRVYCVWRQTDSTVRIYNVEYSYSTDHGSSWSRPKIIDDTDGDIMDVSVSAERETGIDHVYVAWQEGWGTIAYTRSTDGENFDGSRTIRSDVEASAPVIAANHDGHVHIAYTIVNDTNGLNNQDVYIDISGDRGENWGGRTLISSELYDGDSQYPAMVVAGDEIFVVWNERGNISGIENGVNYDIFFRHFDGIAWGDIMVLSDHREDAQSQWPAIAVDGSNVYVVWQEREEGGPDDDPKTAIMVRHSSTKGASWGTVRAVSDPTGGESWYPRVAADGGTGYVVWREMDEGGNREYNILFRSVLNGLPQGTPAILSTDPNSGVSERPDIHADGSTLHAVWHDSGNIGGSGTDYDIIYRRSSDGGRTWGDHVVVSQTGDASTFPRISAGDYIYVIWQESYLTFSRSATGGAGTWSEQQRIGTHTNVQNPTMDSAGDIIVAGYSWSSRVWVTGSSDAGGSWEDPVDVTTDDREYADAPGVGIGGDAIHVVYHDSGNVSGNGWDDDIIHRMTVDSSYPSNVEIDVGRNGNVDWTHPGELNEGNSPRTFSGSTFVNALNTALSTASTFDGGYGNEMADIQLGVSSDTAGLVILDNLIIEYEYEARTPDFSRFLNDYLRDHQDEMDDDGNIEIPLTVTSESAGRITLSDLMVEYELTKALFITSPVGEGVYSTGIDIVWKAKNFASGDEVSISYYDGQWHTLATVPANDENWNGWDTSSMNGAYFKVGLEYTDEPDVRDETDYFMIDNYPPQTRHSFSYRGEYSDGGTTYCREATVTLTAHDQFAGGDEGSGVNRTLYRIDGGPWLEYDGPFVIEDHGAHTFDYYSVDNMGNEETAKQGSVHVDGIQPVVGEWTVPEVRYDSEHTVSISVSVLDGETGINHDDGSINNWLRYAFGDESNPARYQNWKNMDDRELDEGIYHGEITANWSSLTDQWGTFHLWVGVQIADNVGNTNTSQAFEVVEKDIFPPNILSVGSGVDGDTDNTYPLGSVVTLRVTSDEEGLTGSVFIAGGRIGGGNFMANLSGDGTTYTALWDTTNIIAKGYAIKFTLEDAAGNRAVDDSLTVTIQSPQYPELAVTGITIEQRGEIMSDLLITLADSTLASINISVYNSGTLDVTGVDLSVYLNTKNPSDRIGQRAIDLAAREARTVTFDWTPSITGVSEDFTLIAEVELLEGDTIDQNNQESVNVRVRKLPDFTVASVKITDPAGREITRAGERDRVLIVAEIQNIGDAQATLTVSAFYSDTIRIASDGTVNIPAGESRTVTLEWASAVAGVHTIIVRADPGDQVMEQNEDNNEASTALEVRAASTGGGGSDDDDGFPVAILGLLVLVVAGGIGGALFFLKTQGAGKGKDDWGSGTTEDDGWDDEPAAPATAPPPRPSPKPGPVQREPPSGGPGSASAGGMAGKVGTAGTAGMAGTAATTAATATRAASAATSATADTSGKGADASAPPAAAVKVKCPSCQTVLSLKSPQRPVTIKCPKCETKLTIKN